MPSELREKVLEDTTTLSNLLLQWISAGLDSDNIRYEDSVIALLDPLNDRDESSSAAAHSPQRCSTSDLPDWLERLKESCDMGDPEGPRMVARCRAESDYGVQHTSPTSHAVTTTSVPGSSSNIIDSAIDPIHLSEYDGDTSQSMLELQPSRMRFAEWNRTRLRQADKPATRTSNSLETRQLSTGIETTCMYHHA